MPIARPCVAILGFSIECNRFAPVATRVHFSYFTGTELIAEARAEAPRMLGEIPGFVANMDAAGPWDPDELNVWLWKPQQFAKGTKMTFAGLPKPQDRADVIAYLQSLK